MSLFRSPGKDGYCYITCMSAFDHTGLESLNLIDLGIFIETNLYHYINMVLYSKCNSQSDIHCFF